MKEAYLGSGLNLSVKTSNPVELRETLTIVDEGEEYFLDVRVVADFSNIPEKYHEVFLNMLTAKYYGTVKFSENPFSNSAQGGKRRWWEIWKIKL